MSHIFFEWLSLKTVFLISCFSGALFSVLQPKIVEKIQNWCILASFPCQFFYGCDKIGSFSKHVIWKNGQWQIFVNFCKNFAVFGTQKEKTPKNAIFWVQMLKKIFEMHKMRKKLFPQTIIQKIYWDLQENQVSQIIQVGHVSSFFH